MDYNKLSLQMHEKNKGKIEVVSKVKVENREDLSTAYTPGVAEPCRRISENKEDVYRYTAKGNLVAVVSDGTAVLGLGDIGPEAAMPVMEGKAILFKEFADIDAFPICLATKDVNEIVSTVKYLGSAGISICKLLLELGIGNVVLVDRKGALAVGEQWMNSEQAIMAEKTNKYDERGTLQEIIKGKDIFIGVSAPNIVSAEMVSTMAKDAIVFAMANPVPEIMPDEAKKGNARVELSEEYIIPNAFDKRVVKAVSAAVAKAADK